MRHTDAKRDSSPTSHVLFPLRDELDRENVLALAAVLLVVGAGAVRLGRDGVMLHGVGRFSALRGHTPRTGSLLDLARRRDHQATLFSAVHLGTSLAWGVP